MRKVILGLAISLDGFIEGPNGEYDWCFTDQDYGMTDFLSRIDAVVMGRKSYEVAAAMGGENPWKGLTTYVFSRTRKSIQAADTVLVHGGLVEETNKLKLSPGKDIWLFGGAELTSAFISEGLVDELWLSIHPILLGQGKRLFQELKGRTLLRLEEVKEYNTGLVSLRYALQ